MKKILKILLWAVILLSMFAMISCESECTEHTDTDKNHKCDYCGAEYTAECSEHTDTDKNHKCDYCGAEYTAECTEHTDADKNHKCDYCGAEYTAECTEHTDTDKNHKCDYCAADYTAECQTHGDSDRNYKCDYCSEALPLYTRDGEYVYFGEYPQSLKADDVNVAETADVDGYYAGDDGCRYVKVTASPYEDGYTFSNGKSVTEGEVYYFKLEPIRWRILAEVEDGRSVFIMCEGIIDCAAYDADNLNDYKNSDVRAWLNNQFYNTAFDTLQRELIITVTVDNSADSTGYLPNPYVCEDTEDKLFLLSLKEATEPTYSFSSSTAENDADRQMWVSDYSRAIGVWTSTDGKTGGYGFWWLRSPHYNNASYLWYVSADSCIYSYPYSDRVGGIVPAMWITLS